MKTAAATPPAPSSPAPSSRPPTGLDRGGAARPPAPREHTFRTVLAERGGAVQTRPAWVEAPSSDQAAAHPRALRGRSHDSSEREPPEPREAPRPRPPDAPREPGPGSFAPSAPGQIPRAEAIAGALVEPATLAAVAERVLRSLRVGTDPQGRSLVQLDVAEGSLAGCRIQLLRVGGGVAVEVRDEAGAPDAREQVVVDALRRRGIEVV